jgi:catechol 2,3-dioxygenase-like lactoylglutathione lyase family enzyme
MHLLDRLQSAELVEAEVALAVDDLDETLAQLKTQGIEPEREPYRVREGGSRICFVRDPIASCRG